VRGGRAKWRWDTSEPVLTVSARGDRPVVRGDSGATGGLWDLGFYHSESWTAYLSGPPENRPYGIQLLAR